MKFVAGHQRTQRMSAVPICHEPVAIVGIGCRFPGKANSPEELWSLLVNGIDAITDIPKDRWSVEQFYHPDPKVNGTTYSKWGGFLEQIDQFDPGAFGISPREAQSMDPQQRLMLVVSKEAMEDAGQLERNLRGSNTGVFVGISTWDYSLLQYTSQSESRVDSYSATGIAFSIAANRISYCFDFHGPSLIVDTACSSSLVAVHLACESIWKGDCCAAIAGGVNAFISPANAIAFSKMGVLSPDGRCKSFDASANGFVRAEGAGAVLLKPFSQALADGDRIYALIQATGVNQDGVTNGLAVPNGIAQAALMRETFCKAELDPAQVAYVEAHGTGTAVGDPTEAHAIGSVIGAGRSADRCLIGSVKTNIGHLESAAGIAGLIKAALVIQKRIVPRNLHFHTPNPHIDFQALGLEIAVETRQIRGNHSGLILAAVNSFGFGGTNGLAILSSVPVEHRPSPTTSHLNGSNGAILNDTVPRLIPLSAISGDRLAVLANSWVDFLSQENSLDDIAHTAARRRETHSHRLCVVATDRGEAAVRLRAYLNDERTLGVVSGEFRPTDSAPRIAFVFSGQGPQWWGMGRRLFECNDVYRGKLEECDQIVRRSAGWSLIDALSAAEDASRIRETAIAQPALCALQIALAEVWKSWGIVPGATVGHSVGELAAAYVSGHLTLEEALRIVLHRGQCIQQFAERGQMLAVAVGHERAHELLGGCSGSRLAIAAYNAPGNVTFAGDAPALESLVRRLDHDGVHRQLLHVDFAFHSELMEGARKPFLAALGSTHHRVGHTVWMSTVTGRLVENDICSEYWWNNVRNPVRFVQAFENLLDQGYDTIVELSPHPVLLPSMTESLRSRQLAPRVASSLRRGEDDAVTMLANLGALHCWGCPVDWQALYPGHRHPITLPAYPWKNQSFWSDDRHSWRIGRSHPILGSRIGTHQPVWQTTLDLHRLPFLNDHRLQNRALLPATAYIDMGLAVAHEVLGVDRPILENIEIRKALFLPTEPDTVELLTEYNESDREIRFLTRPSHTTTDWTLHCKIRLGGEHTVSTQPQFSPDEVIARCPDSFPGEIIYELSEGSQLVYRGPFRSLKQFWRSSTEVIAQIELPADYKPSGDGYFFHPALLDSCIQAGNLNRPFGLSSSTLQQVTFVPVSVAEVRLFQKPISRSLWVHVVKSRDTFKSHNGDISIYDENGDMVLAFHGFESQGLERRATGDGSSIDDWTYELQFIPRPGRSLLRSSDASHQISHPLSLSTIACAVRESAAGLVADFSRNDRLDRLTHNLNRIALKWLTRAFQQLGLHKHLGQSLSFDDIIAACGIVPEQIRYTQFALKILAETGVFKQAGSRLILSSVDSDSDEAASLWRETLMEFPAACAELMILHNLGHRLPELLTGKTSLKAQLFQPGSEGLIEHFYQDSIGLIPCNIAVASAVSHLVKAAPKDRKIRILEVGAGTGGITSHLLPLLDGLQVEYIFTDISPAFLMAARRRYPEFSFVEYRGLDLAQNPVEQGFEPNEFDIVIAANVLHAVPDLAQSISHIRQLLAARGVFCMLEVTRTPYWVHSIFGLAQEWWLLQQGQMEPLSRREWQSILGETFSELAELSDGMPSPSSTLCENAIFLGRVADSRETRQSEMDSDECTVNLDPLAEKWLILTDRQRLGNRLAGRLIERGGSSKQLSIVDGVQSITHAIRSAAESGTPYHAIVHLWGLDCTPNDQLSIETIHENDVLTWESALAIFQAVAELGKAIRPKVYAITRGLEPVDDIIGPNGLCQSSIRGVVSTATCEYPGLTIRLIDLDPEVSARDQIETLLQEMTVDNAEQEVAFRNDVRFVARLRKTSLTEIPDNEQVRVSHVLQNSTNSSASSSRFALHVPGTGIFDRIRYREAKQEALRGHQLEVRVIAAGLNFRDVLKVLGLYPLDGDYLALGDECAGVVERIGDAVTEFKPGDEVICVGGPCFASHVVTSEHLTMPKPAHLMFEEAATLPIAFLTAHYCLNEIARLQPGERILIHAAAGGVGLAAVQLAQQTGAEIFGTASDRKRQFLNRLGVQHVLDSRSLDFASEIHKITGGHGVDVVLNSLAGEAIPKSLSILARYGRFIEIGKRDLYENRKIGLGYFREGASFHSVDLSRVMADKPDLIRRMRQDLIANFQSGRLRPLPLRIFAANRVREAFRTMAEAKHIGKIVISFRQTELRMERALPESLSFVADATYLITGGCGGFGLEIARALLANGARNIVLLGRSDLESDRVRNALARLDAFHDARIAVLQTDVSDQAALASVFDRIADQFPPLRGVVHAAGVLEDGPLVQLHATSFQNVMSPKVDGLWNLHELTKNLDLDFLLLTSSTSSLLGNPGQGNYAAANSFLDTFVRFRRMQGLPATVVNFGPLADSGMVARDQSVADRMMRIGVATLPTAKAIEVIRAVLVRNRPQVGALRVRWSRWLDAMGFADVPTKILDVHAEDSTSSVADQNSNELRESLLHATAADRQELVVDYLSSVVARVLGASAEKLDRFQPLQNLGLDSLTTVELCNRLENDLAITVPLSELAKRPSITQLSDVLLGLLPQGESQATEKASS